MHILIVGPQGVGKSTLLHRVLAHTGTPVWGFETKKEDSLGTKGQGSPVYIYDVGVPRQQSEENLLGYCDDRCINVNPETFQRYASRLRAPVPQGHVVLMDELGTMESRSPEFCRAVLDLLDGEVPVIAAVKHKDTAFLNAVRSHPRTICFSITEENRDSLLAEILAILNTDPQWKPFL